MTASLGAGSCGRRAVSCDGEPIKAAPRGATTISGQASQSLKLLASKVFFSARSVLAVDGALGASDAVTMAFDAATGAGAASATGGVGAGLAAGASLTTALAGWLAGAAGAGVATTGAITED